LDLVALDVPLLWTLVICLRWGCSFL